jgi:hypothetical protein
VWGLGGVGVYGFKAVEEIHEGRDRDRDRIGIGIGIGIGIVGI